MCKYQEMYRNVVYGVAALAGVVGAYQIKHTAQQARDLNTFARIELNRNIRKALDTYETEKYLIKDNPLMVPDTRRIRDRLRNYEDELANIDLIGEEILSPKVLAEKYSMEINLVSTTPYIMDQLLLKPETHSSFLNLIQKSIDAQRNTETKTLRYVDSAEFIKDLQKNITECKPIRDDLEKKFRDAVDQGNRPNREEYEVHCPYTKRFLKNKEAARKPKQKRD
jgi:hypothetical protein